MCYHMIDNENIVDAGVYYSENIFNTNGVNLYINTASDIWGK